MPDPHRAGTDRWHQLQAEVAEADHALSPATYNRMKQACIDRASDPDAPQQPQRPTSERDRPEFLLCVDRTGSPAPLSQAILADFRRTADRCPDFGRWFQPAPIDGEGPPTLLVARWLCHRVGLRHRAVHLFIDHPTVQDYTLVQVRGLSKAEGPGCFGVPAAGHVAGLTPIIDALFTELGEELGLTRDGITAPERIGCYDYRDAGDRSDVHNVEFRTVFRSRLMADSVLAMRFSDGEVAGIGFFVVSELRALVKAFPKRVSSGLAASLPVYVESRK